MAFIFEKWRGSWKKASLVRNLSVPTKNLDDAETDEVMHTTLQEQRDSESNRPIEEQLAVEHEYPLRGDAALPLHKKLAQMPQLLDTVHDVISKFKGSHVVQEEVTEVPLNYDLMMGAQIYLNCNE